MSVNLNISMVRYLRRHLVCTTDCLHEQEWWILMCWSCQRRCLTVFRYSEVFGHWQKNELIERIRSGWHKPKLRGHLTNVTQSTIWSCGHRSRSPMCTVRPIVYLIETPGDFTWKKAESIQLCDFRVGQASAGAEVQFWLRQPWRNLPPLFPNSPSDFCPSPFLTRVWGYHHGKIWN